MPIAGPGVLACRAIYMTCYCMPINLHDTTHMPSNLHDMLPASPELKVSWACKDESPGYLKDERLTVSIRTVSLY